MPTDSLPPYLKVEAERSESVFEDFKEAFGPAQAVVEANRCLFCADAPCIKACPTAIDIPQFIRKIATGNIKGSARTILEANILGMSCARVCPVEVLCVGDCVYNHMDQPPIQIGKLQRYSTDIAFEKGWRYARAGQPTGKSIGLVGGGPASLACAHELRRLGHACTIYEKRPVLGGLNTTGVAPYKLRADRSVTEVDWVLAIGGIEVKTGVEIGKDLTWAQLEAAHDALFIGLGLGPDTRLGVPGEQLANVHGAVDYIELFKLGKVSLDGVKRAAVIGGGNTAIDAVRELIGLGVPEVTMVYRGVESKMSGYIHEWEAARIQSARALWQSQPVELTGKDRVEGVRCLRMDASKKPVPGSDHVLATDLVLLAIGQAKLADLLAGLEGIRIDSGRLIVDKNGFTGRPRYYSGGDCANGGKEVVNAAAEGKAAARGIHSLLSGGDRA